MPEPVSATPATNLAGVGMATIVAVTASLPLALNAAWPAAVSLTLADDNPRRGGSVTQGLAMTIGLYWDTQALYLDGWVHEPTPLTNNRDNDKIWDGDALELALGTRTDADPRRTTFGGGDFHVGIATAGQARGWNWTAGRPLQALEVVTGTIKGGYRLRARLAWSNFDGFQPEAGQVVPFDLALDDARMGANGYSTRTSQLIWHGDESFNTNPAVWGYATFAAPGDRAALSSTPGGLAGGVEAAPEDGRSPGYGPGIKIDATRAITTVSPLAFGATAGSWQQLTPGQESLARAAGIRTLRFPGRSTGGEPAWGEKDLDAFMDQARQLGATPIVTVRLAGNTPAEAAQLVRYARDQGDAIRYWAIGAEPDRYDADRVVPGYTVARFNQDWRAFALAMIAADPTIVLVGPEISRYVGGPDDPGDSTGVNWMDGFLLGNGDLVGLVSFHRYPFQTGGQSGARQPVTPHALLANPGEWDRTVPFLRTRIDALTGRDLPVAVTEINSDRTGLTGGQTTPDSLLNALWWADVQGRLLRQGVPLAQACCLTGAGGLSLLAESPRPAYYVFKLYGHFGDRLLAVDAPPDLPAYAALAGDGALTLLVVNRAETVVTVPINVAGFKATGLAQGWLLDAMHQAESFVSSEPASNSFVYAFPPRSVTLLRLPAR
ncbi:MAG TPA: hypothetical protein VGA61_05710 [Anaerolineae bacterium]